MPPIVNETQAVKLFGGLIEKSVDAMNDAYNRDVLDPLLAAIADAPIDPTTGEPDIESLLVDLPEVFDSMRSTALESAIAGTLTQAAMLGRAVGTPDGVDLGTAPINDPFAIEDEPGGDDDILIPLSLHALQKSDFNPKPSSGLANLFGKKAAVSSKLFDTLSREQRARAFRIAGINRATLIQRAMDEIRSGLRKGTSRREIQLALQQIFADAGVQGLPNWHLTVLMRQNMFTTYNVARKRASETPAVVRIFPYRQYVTAGDSSVRPEHAALDGKIFLKSDPFWDTHFPPWAWNCRCGTRDVSQREVDRKGGQRIVIDKDFALNRLRIEGQDERGVGTDPDFAFPRDQFGPLDALALRTVEGKLRDFVNEALDRED